MNINQNYREAVRAIKEAILRSQYRAAASANKEQLSLYYGIGRYVSENSRTGFWGKGAIEQISSLLQKELPGLRGFSVSNIKNMRVFYEEWEPVLNRQPAAGDLILDEKLLLSVIRQPVAGDLEQVPILHRKLAYSLYSKLKIPLAPAILFATEKIFALLLLYPKSLYGNFSTRNVRCRNKEIAVLCSPMWLHGIASFMVFTASL
jgi:hypothetical protein